MRSTAAKRKEPESRLPRLLVIRSAQRSRKLNLPWLRRIARDLLDCRLPLAGYELGLHLVADAEMARINMQFLGHAGSTDVITFDHQSSGAPDRLHGELFLCVDAAVRQAREFGTTWQEEVIRYLVHGTLHLRGYDDMAPASRRRMKREENRLVRVLAGRFALRKLDRELPSPHA